MAKGKARIASKDASRHRDVLLENIEKHFRLILEGHTGLDKKIEAAEEHLGKRIDEFRYEVRTEMGFLKLGQSVASNQLKDLQVKTDQNFKIIREYLSRIDDEIQDLKKVFHGKPEMKRLMQLEERMAQVELVVKKYYGKGSN